MSDPVLPVGPIAAVATAIPATFKELAALVGAAKPAPEILSLKIALRLARHDKSTAKYLGDLMEARARFAEVAARKPGWGGHDARAKLAGIEAELLNFEQLRAMRLGSTNQPSPPAAGTETGEGSSS